MFEALKSRIAMLVTAALLAVSVAPAVVILAPTVAQAQIQDTDAGVHSGINRNSLALDLRAATCTKVLNGVTTTPSFASCITFARSGTAWVQNSSWVYTMVADGVVRQSDLGVPNDPLKTQYARQNASLDVTHQLTVTGGSGTFTNGETVTATGGGSGTYIAPVGNTLTSTATIYAISGGSGTFTGTLTGGSSGATKTISSSATVWNRTNMAVTADQVGFDGQANRGSRLHANTNNATLCQSVVDATARNRGNFWIVKRVSGTGRIWATQDNFSTQTVELLVGSNTSYQVYQLTAFGSTKGNPIVCVKIETSGDEFAILAMQNESSSSLGAISTLIPAFTVGGIIRNAETLSVADSSFMGNYDRGTIRVEIGNQYGIGAFFREAVNIRFGSNDKYVIELQAPSLNDAMRPALGSTAGASYEAPSTVPVNALGIYRAILSWEEHSCHAAMTASLAINLPSQDCTNLPTISSTGLTPTIYIGSNAGGQNQTGFARYFEAVSTRDSNAVNNAWAN